MKELFADLSQLLRQILLKTKMFELNAARVAFKHHGNLPLPPEEAKFAGYTEEFPRAVGKS